MRSVSLRAKVLMVAAAAIALYVVFGPNDTDPVAPVERSAGADRPPLHTTRAAAAATSNARADSSGGLLRLAHRVSAAAAADALFAPHSWYRPPPPPPAPRVDPAAAAAQAAAAAAAAAPRAPPLPFAFIGSYTPAGESTVFFLTLEDRVYDVRVGDTVINTYKVDTYDRGQLLMTYLPLHQQQALSIGESP